MHVMSEFRCVDITLKLTHNQEKRHNLSKNILSASVRSKEVKIHRFSFKKRNFRSSTW